MRHRRAGVHLSRPTAHRKALFSNLVAALLTNERIRTTDAKAKETRRLAERTITWARRVGDILVKKADRRTPEESARVVHAVRMARRMVRDRVAVSKLFDEIGPRYLARRGGYTRIVKIGQRAGDAAPMSLLELIPEAGGQVAAEKTVKPPFQSVLSKTGSCDDIGLALYNREEGPPGSTPGSDFSPLPPGAAGPALCWESNVLTFSNSNVLGSGNKYNIATAESAGWMNLTFAYAGAINVAATPVGYDPVTGLLFTPSTTFAGLPTIGFAVQTFVNGTLTDSAGKLIQSSYGGNFGHRYVGPQP